MALQMLYQQDLAGGAEPDIVGSFDLDSFAAEEHIEASPEELERSFEYAQQLFNGGLAHREEIDERIARQAENWRVERMPAVDRNILRLAVYELLHQPDVPAAAVLNEAIELAKRYGSEQSGAFINGLLDAMVLALDETAGS
jgi:N utilization substance protein B